MSSTSIEEYKEILTKTLECIDRYCRENHIRYYLLGGTLLGAVRHQGFIPWDDDIDIGMPREDYDRFCREFNKNRNDPYRVIGLNNNEKYYLPYAKVIDTDTELKENAYQAIPIGAYIDVFPLDYISEQNYEAAAGFLNGRSPIWKIRGIKRINLSKTRTLFKDLAIVCSRILCWESIHSISVKYDDHARKISEKEPTAYIANLCGAWGNRELVDHKLFSDTAELTFEGRKYFAPIGYDEYLRSIYGDYMQLPPVEKRVAHHDFEVYRKQNQEIG